MSSTSRTVKDVFSRGAQIAWEDESVVEVAKRMKEHDIGFLPVGSRESDKLCGTITDRDITLNAVAAAKSMTGLKVKDVMNERKPVYVVENDSLERARDLMSSHQVRRLPVLNKDHRLTGVVSLGDLAEEPQIASQVHEAVTEDRT